MPKLIDLTGQEFGRLTVLAEVEKGRWGRRWLCECDCDCGNLTIVYAGNLRTGNTQSCGCLQRERAGQSNSLFKTKHGHAISKYRAATPTYGSWQSMINRVERPDEVKLRYYGHVRICSRWRGDFQAFLDDLGERPDGHTLDRIDPFGNYSCGRCDECKEEGWEPNCRWATPLQQAHNHRRHHQEAA